MAVAVGLTVAVAVDCAVAVGGTDVGVGDTGIAVGGIGVTVGDTGVAICGTGVDVSWDVAQDAESSTNKIKLTIRDTSLL